MIISAIIFIIIGLLLSYLGIHNCGLKQQYSFEELQIFAFMAFIAYIYSFFISIIKIIVDISEIL